MKTSEINLTIELDDKNVPEKISWIATDGETGKHESSAMLLAMWDHKLKSGMSIDLWTKDMTIPEMNIFFYQTFLTLSDTFFRATQNKELSEGMKKFANDFFDKVKDGQ